MPVQGQGLDVRVGTFADDETPDNGEACCDEQRDATDEALDAWEAAEKTYRDESAHYISTGWGGDPVEPPERGLTVEALKNLRDLGDWPSFN